MPIFEFGLTVNPSIEHKLEELAPILNDATIGVRNGEWFILYTREAPTLREAINQAVKELENNGIATLGHY